jgi:predicted transposase YdaD
MGKVEDRRVLAREQQKNITVGLKQVTIDLLTTIALPAFAYFSQRQVLRVGAV